MPSHRKAERNGESDASKLASGLYVVATPLGNLGDISRRAIAILGAVEIIACEDTRVTARLLQALGIGRPRLVRYDDHASDRTQDELVDQIRAGKAVALVSDAGTPLISDPGYRLVRAVREAGLAVTAIPGPSAAVAALSISGLPTDRFLCSGFLPQKPGPRRKALEELAQVPATLVVFEAPHRLPECLVDMAAVLGPREAAVVRELTKLFEETRRGTLDELAAHYAAAGPPKGEVVIVVGPPPRSGDAAADMAALDARLAAALATSSVRDAAAAVAEATGLSRRQVYARALELAKGRS
ncbi:MAG TPA: 16S rRNA (cytidine(1402)-2'-O)-methyltransferase [Alphaproteobacteria bacterium]